MEDALNMLVLHRCDDDRNMARFYVLRIEPTLFGNFGLVREWGRLGTRGRSITQFMSTREAACEELEAWLERKAKRGYRTV